MVPLTLLLLKSGLVLSTSREAKDSFVGANTVEAQSLEKIIRNGDLRVRKVGVLTFKGRIGAGKG